MLKIQIETVLQELKCIALPVTHEKTYFFFLPKILENWQVKGKYMD